MTLINPYNFVPLKKPERAAYTPQIRLNEDGYTGVLHIVLTAISPLITLDQRKKRRVEITVLEKNKDTRQMEKRQAKIDCHGFLRRDDTPIIQGSTLRGLIRSVFEAISGSCLVHSPEALKNTDHTKKVCRDDQELCPACRLFGVIGGEQLIIGSRLSFSDAELLTGENKKLLEPAPEDPGFWVIKEQSSPKPRHRSIYYPGDEVAGRKFYYHQNPEPHFEAKEKATRRCAALTEVAPTGAEFGFSVSFSNLSKDEMKLLLLAIELDSDLGHKVGFGKNAGLGSCQLKIKDESRVSHGSNRYLTLDRDGDTPWRELQGDPQLLSPSMREVLRLNKHEDGNIAYLSFFEYKRNKGINRKGVFLQGAGGNDAASNPVSMQSKPLPKPPPEFIPETTTDKPVTPDPPPVRGDQIPVWLSGENKTRLQFTGLDGSPHIIFRKQLQGISGKALVLGHWFYREGSRGVRAFKK